MFVRQLLRTIIILLPLFCFTWVIGLFAVAPGQAGQVFAVLFIVANSLQVLYNQFSFHVISVHLIFVSLYDSYLTQFLYLYIKGFLYICASCLEA